MKKSAEIFISGLFDSVDEEPVVTKTKGTHMVGEGSHYITYEEKDEHGNVVLNRLKVEKDSATLKKSGAVATQITYAKGSRMITPYYLPFGEMELEVFTKEYSFEEMKNGFFLEILYSLSMNGEGVSDCRLKITVRDE